LLPNARVRPNLHILANTVVKLINFDNNRRAVSVIIDRSGVESLVGVRKEVIVSAGAINSAKLLMLSGIGPKDHLQELNIPVVADLPVGLNFHDNPIVFGVHFTINSTKESKELTEKDLTEFFMDGSGTLTNAYKPVLRVTINSTSDAQIFVSLGSISDFDNEDIAEKVMNLRKDVWTQFYKPYSNETTLTFTPLLSRPKSRGFVRLRSQNFNDEPIVNPNCFANSIDLKVMVEAMKLSLKLGETNTFVNAFETKSFSSILPNCTSNQNSYEYLECVAKSLTSTYSHTAGTCRMGSVNDSVVSSQLRVHLIDNLRVIDASVVPQSTSGALYATTVMIGERGAKFILDYYSINNSNSINSSYIYINFIIFQILFSLLYILIDAINS
jgi:choline dehydrogenase-like flavoprotein